MIKIDEGYKYGLQDFESDTVQPISFIKKAPISPGSPEMETLTNGTTNEEVLKMLIDRVNFLNAKFPCRENSLAITKLEESLMWLNRRTENRVSRGVEGKHVK